MENNAEIIKMIEKLAGKFGFDVEEAKAFVMEKSDNASDTGSEKVKLSPIEKARKNLTVWNEKLVANKFKDEESKKKHEEKIAKEQAKLDKLESASEVKPKATPKKAKAKKEEEKVEETETKPKPAPKKAKAKKEEEKVEETKPESEPEVTPKKAKKTEEVPKAPKKGKKEEAEAETDKAEKRIKRMSPTLQKQFAEVLYRGHLETTDERKREFLMFIEELTDDEFKAKGLIDHMRDYAKSVNDRAGSDWGGGGDNPQFDKPPVGDGKSEREAVALSLDELRSIKMTATIEPVGTYWDADNGRYVKGPEEDEDEDMINTPFEGKEYGVGEKTGRVYLEVNDRDVFQGFLGVGAFKTMMRL